METLLNFFLSLTYADMFKLVLSLVTIVLLVRGLFLSLTHADMFKLVLSLVAIALLVRGLFIGIK